jgi:glycosyltransferase involved in cell wall biosynthesis
VVLVERSPRPQRFAFVRTIAVIPAWNAGTTVGAVVRGVKGAVPGIAVLVIDDGSADGTSAAAREAGADVIRHAVNRGKGAALQTGFDEAIRRGAEGVLTLDADGQHDPASAAGLLAELDRSDVVVGSRDKDRTGMPWIRRATNSVMTRIVSGLAGKRIEDTQSGYRAVRVKVLAQVRPLSTRFEYESEFLIEAGRRGFTIGSVPIPTLYNAPGSHIDPFRDTARFIRLLYRRWTH